MRRILWIFTIVVGIGGGAEAQQLTEPKKWDISGSAASFAAKPERPGSDAQYQDDWYFEGRYAVAIGRYWTEQLKTEVEFATSGEGSTYHFISPRSLESFHRLDQVSARTVWQFGKNKWVHPYVSGGVVVERDRHRVRYPEQYQYPSGRTSGPMIRIPESTSGTTSHHRAGVTAGAGAKIYMAPNAFFNTGVIGTYSKRAATLSFLAGFGIDF